MGTFSFLACSQNMSTVLYRMSKMQARLLEKKEKNEFIHAYSLLGDFLFFFLRILPLNGNSYKKSFRP